MAAVRNFAYGGIAVDSIALSPGCRLSSGKPLNSLSFVWFFFKEKCSTSAKIESRSLCCDTSTISHSLLENAGNGTWPSFPKPPKKPCAEPDKMCDFHGDCAGGEDEDKCGGSICPLPSASLLSTALQSFKIKHDCYFPITRHKTLLCNHFVFFESSEMWAFWYMLSPL